MRAGADRNEREPSGRAGEALAGEHHEGSDRFLAPIVHRRAAISDRVATRWYRSVDRAEALAGRVTDAIRQPWYRTADGIGGGWDRLVDRTTGADSRGIRLGAAALIAMLSFLIATSVIAIDRSSRSVPGATVSTRPDTDGETRAEGSTETTAASEDQLPGVNVHVNEAAGYLFSYPDGWDLSTSGTTTVVLSPDGEVMISFDVAPPGRLSRVSDRIVRDLTASHDNVRLVSDEVQQTPQGERSIVIGGEATDATGSPITFLAITIRGDDQNRAILVRFGAGSDPVHALPEIEEIIASFRTSRTG
jgi:hypothetical protein